MNKCPICGLEDKDVTSVAIHEMSVHGWDYEQAQDWIRAQAEMSETGA